MFSFSRYNKPEDLDISMSLWHACIQNYKLALIITGCTTMTAAILANHESTMARLTEQISKPGILYKPIVLVRSRSFPVCIFRVSVVY